MSSPTQGMWTCRHGVDGRDWCAECYADQDGVHVLGEDDVSFPEDKASTGGLTSWDF